MRMRVSKSVFEFIWLKKGKKYPEPNRDRRNAKRKNSEFIFIQIDILHALYTLQGLEPYERHAHTRLKINGFFCCWSIKINWALQIKW